MKYEAFIRVRGRVQGVFFRAHTKKQAKNLGLVGWIRNENDGTISILVQGKKDKLEDLTRWLQESGPPFAKIEKIDITWRGRVKNIFSDFDITY